MCHSCITWGGKRRGASFEVITMPKATTGTEVVDTFSNLHSKALLTFTMVFETAMYCWDEWDFWTLSCRMHSVLCRITCTFFFIRLLHVWITLKIVNPNNLYWQTHTGILASESNSNQQHITLHGTPSKMWPCSTINKASRAAHTHTEYT